MEASVNQGSGRSYLCPRNYYLFFPKKTIIRVLVFVYICRGKEYLGKGISQYLANYITWINTIPPKASIHLETEEPKCIVSHAPKENFIPLQYLCRQVDTMLNLNSTELSNTSSHWKSFLSSW